MVEVLTARVGTDAPNWMANAFEALLALAVKVAV
jgi:hypothetical protein